MKKFKEQEKDALSVSDAVNTEKENDIDYISGDKADKYAEFEKLISGEFKEQFEQRVKEIVEPLINEEKEALRMQETIREWMKDGEYLKEQYPDFDLNTEVENPDFVNLLKGGVNLKNAYFALHHDEIVKMLIEKATEDAKLKTLDSIRARNSRPLENGMAGKSTALFKTDVSKLTPHQREEIARRVAGGEKISF